MECTQRLECTQDLYETHSQRTCPEEIGFLGICGTKYPVKKGPNKIGRDPQTCSIILNLNSVSRQHAVINILSNTNFMLMDLDSANKTKLGGNKLHPYIPHPLKDGDTVQFGDVFGVFRLLEQDDELPMTQAIDIPDTPMTNHCMSRINKAAVTMVPESPDVSDRDDSFVAPSQRDGKIESNHHFIKPSGKTVSIQPIGSNKIDNIYWNSCKKSKSLSLSLNNSNASFDTSDPTIINRLSNGNSDIHEMETQDPNLDKIESVGSIHSAETQMPDEIYSQDTQVVPTANSNRPGVQKVNTQHEMQINLYASNKENKDDLYDAETQLYHKGEPSISGTPRQILNESIEHPSENTNDKINSSNDPIIFDEIDTQSLEGPFDSQSIIPEDEIIPNLEEDPKIEKNKDDVDGKQDSNVSKRVSKRANRINSGDSTDCEDMETALTQIIQEKPNISDEDVTDCEDVENKSNKASSDKNNDQLADIEDLQTQIIVVEKSYEEGERLEEMATQIIIVEDTRAKKSMVDKNPEEEIDFEDLPTQIINEEVPIKLACRQVSAEEYSQEMIGSFKIPFQVPLKNKRKEVPVSRNEVISIEDDHYYQSTQDVLADLCSQAQNSPEVVVANNNVLKKKSTVDDKPLSSVIECVIGSNIKHNEISQNHTTKKSNDNENYEKVSKKVNNKEVNVQKLKRVPSDSSDFESTPRKGTGLNFTDSDLPNSQEIKKSVNINSKCDIDVFSSDSDTENNSQDDDNKTPLLYNKQKKRKNDAKLNLTKKFEADALPTRIITRVRKPTERAELYKSSSAILKPKFLTEQEDGIDKEIITENISRLKTNSEKSKSHTKDTNKVINKSNGKKVKDNEKTGASVGTSKTCKSQGKHANSIISKDTTHNKLEKSNSNFEPKNISRKTRSKNKDISGTKDKKFESLENTKPQLESKTRPTTLDRFLQTKESNQSKVTLNSTEISNVSTNRPKRSRKEKLEVRSLSPDCHIDEVKPKRTYSKRTKKTADKESELTKPPEQETELRRSTRKKTTKNVKENETATLKPKSILKSTCNESAVYNKSSESVSDSPNGLKRCAVNELEVPSPKRTRTANELNCSLRPPKTHCVLFTTFPEEGVQAKLEKLGAVTVTDVNACTVLLTSGLRRTFKLLCAVGLGRPVVGPTWVQACLHTNTIVDPWLYILKDEAAEKRFQFNLERTLLGKRNYLKGFTVSSTPSVVPAEPEMKQIVECSGGRWGCGDGGDRSRWVVVTTPRDSSLWAALGRRGATLVTSEFVLAGVLKQIPDIQPYIYNVPYS